MGVCKVVSAFRFAILRLKHAWWFLVSWSTVTKSTVWSSDWATDLSFRWCPQTRPRVQILRNVRLSRGHSYPRPFQQRGWQGQHFGIPGPPLGLMKTDNDNVSPSTIYPERTASECKARVKDQQTRDAAELFTPDTLATALLVPSSLRHGSRTIGTFRFSRHDDFWSPVLRRRRPLPLSHRLLVVMRSHEGNHSSQKISWQPARHRHCKGPKIISPSCFKLRPSEVCALGNRWSLQASKSTLAAWAIAKGKLVTGNHPAPCHCNGIFSASRVKMMVSVHSSILSTARPASSISAFYQLIQQGEAGPALSPSGTSIAVAMVPSSVHTTTAPARIRHYTLIASLLQQSYRRDSTSNSFWKQKPSRYPTVQITRQWYHHSKNRRDIHWQWQSWNQACSYHSPDIKGIHVVTAHRVSRNPQWYHATSRRSDSYLQRSCPRTVMVPNWTGQAPYSPSSLANFPNHGGGCAGFPPMSKSLTIGFSKPSVILVARSMARKVNISPCCRETLLRGVCLILSCHLSLHFTIIA